MSKESDSTHGRNIVGKLEICSFGIANNAFDQAIEVVFVFFTEVSGPLCSVVSGWSGYKPQLRVFLRILFHCSAAAQHHGNRNRYSFEMTPPDHFATLPIRRHKMLCLTG